VPTRVHNPNGISIVSAIFAQLTEECRRACPTSPGMSCPFPKNCAFAWGYLDPHLIRDSLDPPESSTQTASRLVQPFCTADRKMSLYFTVGWAALFPSKLPLPVGGPGPHLIHDSLGPPESSTQMASRSVQPLCKAHYGDRQTDPQTYHGPRYSVSNNRPHLRA